MSSRANCLRTLKHTLTPYNPPCPHSMMLWFFQMPSMMSLRKYRPKNQPATARMSVTQERVFHQPCECPCLQGNITPVVATHKSSNASTDNPTTICEKRVPNCVKR